MQWLQDAGEPEPDITYAEALKRPDKEGFYYPTFVKWSKKLATKQKVTLKSIGEIEIALPPKLPQGYKMRWHESWNGLRGLLYDPNKKMGYSYEYLDNVSDDIRELHGLLGWEIDPNGDLIDRPDYIDWSEGFDRSWFLLNFKFQELYKRARAKFGEFNCSTVTHKNRVMAPEYEEVLGEFLNLARDPEVLKEIEGEYDDLD